MNIIRYKEVIHADFSKDAEFMERVIKEIGLNPDAKILDIGTGFGAMAILLALNGYDVLTGQPENDPEWDEHAQVHHEHGEGHEGHHEHGFHPEMMDWRKNARKAGVLDKISFQFLDALNLDFADKSFDGIFMYDVLQHIEDRKRVLLEATRVLSENGAVCVFEWNKRSKRETEEKEGFTIDYIDPRKILKGIDFRIDLFEGDYLNAFIIRRA
jgi:ubiquinone/menaquinone biosynthesis C-methylase UbiE